ncbi:MAG: ATP-binding protein, partial [Candidatus Aminicenantaceae bacterium]
AQVTVELNRDLKALTRSTYEGTLEIGRINSYIIIPVGARRIVVMVTRVLLTEESELKADKTMVTLPSSRRLMKATMIGSIDEGRFRQGINLFPVLDTPVLITTKQDLDAIFGKSSDNNVVTSDEPGFCVPVGRSAVFRDYDIKIDPDAFFGKHVAIIGSTGSGKSCTIATIIQSIIHQASVKQTRFVILDTNGEYRSAFQKQNDNGVWADADAAFKTLYIPTDPAEQEKLAIPYWFMDSDDFVRLFRASPGVQRPVLLNALSSARDSEGGSENWVHVRQNIIQECNRILGLCTGTEGRDAKTLRQLCDGMTSYLDEASIVQQLAILTEHYPEVTADSLKTLFENVRDIAREGIRNEGQQFESYAAIDVSKRNQIESAIKPVLGTLTRFPEKSADLGFSSSDCPRFFSKSEFRYRHLESAMSRDDASSSRSRDNCSAMLMRIYRLLEDSRFEFLFGPTCAEWPKIEHSLATFIRDILGVESCSEINLSNSQECPEGQLPFYDRKRRGSSRSNVVIIDLSLLASEVLENVTALISRLIHEFLQRLTDQQVSGISRGEYPVVLVLEEAQNYIRESRRTEEDSISKLVFERIAREGRKYGLGLVVASQRPSELSKTVLSQCNSFIVHRLQNPEDLRYFREIVPGIYGQMLDQLPALAPRSALVLGECVQAPALAEMREASPIPKSRNPMFYRSWTQDEKQPDFEAVCEKWEGKQPDCPVPNDQPHTTTDNEAEEE